MYFSDKVWDRGSNTERKVERKGKTSGKDLRHHLTVRGKCWRLQVRVDVPRASSDTQGFCFPGAALARTQDCASCSRAAAPVCPAASLIGQTEEAQPVLASGGAVAARWQGMMCVLAVVMRTGKSPPLTTSQKSHFSMIMSHPGSVTGRQWDYYLTVHSISAGNSRELS